MMKSNKFRQVVRSSAALLAMALMTLTSCTTVDDTLGANLVPENQQMKAGYVSLPGINGLNLKKMVETRLYQTDSIIGSNISYGYMGSTYNDTLGSRTAGFLSQYISYYKIDEGYFGYKPLFDSAQLLLSISNYGGDTMQVQQFEVYEVISNKYLTDKPIAPGKTVRDSVFYIGTFNPKTANPDKSTILGEKLFTFALGDKKGPSANSVTLQPTEAGRQFISRLMLQTGEHKGKYDIYKTENLAKFIEVFKGLYICPEKDQTSKGGAVYSTTLEATALSVYGRNRREDDPSLIKDTIGMVYYFYDAYADHGNVSVNHIRHDYTGSKIDIEQAKETNTSRAENRQAFIEGMGGVVTEITFSKEFFEELQQIVDKSDQGFKTLAFNQVRMSVYFPQSQYDWEKITPDHLMIEQMNAAPKRLGLYTNYKRMTAITDYAYAYENAYGTTLAYGGYINRSRACYVMDITGYMQQLWRDYVKVAEAAGGPEKINWQTVEIANRKIYMAPEAYSLYTPSYTVLQGQMQDQLNNAPIRFDVTYTMIK